MESTQELLRNKEELRLMLKATQEWLAQDGQWIAEKYSDILITRFGHTVMHQPSLRVAVMELMSVITATFLTGYYRGQEKLKSKKLILETQGKCRDVCQQPDSLI